MRLSKIVICALIVCSMVSIGYSQTNQNKDARALANELSRLVFGDGKELLNASVGAITDGMRKIVKTSFEQNPQTRPYADILGQAVIESVEDFFRDPETLKQFRDAQVDIFIETYTAQEMQEIINFYNTPVGKKTIKTLPDVMRKGGERGMAIGQNMAASPKYKKMMEDKIAKLKKEGKLPADFK